MDKQFTSAIITKSADKDADFEAVISTATKDRHGEIVDVEGWDFKAFKENPVLLWAHDHSEMAVGQAKKIWIDKTGKKPTPKIQGFIHEATEKGRALKYLVKEGIIKTMSVGFRPIDMDDNRYTKQELLEVSFVNVPANPQAQITAYKSLQDAGFKKSTMEELGIPAIILDRVEDLDKKVKQLETVVKAQSPVNPQGRTDRARRTRLAMLKVIVRAADKLNEGEKKHLPRKDKARLIKVIKKSTELIIVDEKKVLKNGENQRASRKVEAGNHI